MCLKRSAHVCLGRWKRDVSPLRSGARTISVKGLVVGRPNAESPSAGCGAGSDRTTSALSRSTLVSHWRRWISSRVCVFPRKTPGPPGNAD